MSDKNILITQEIGSFRKPEYLSRIFHSIEGKPEFSELAGKAALETLEIFHESGLMNSGIAGEMFRWEMYEYLARRIRNIEFHGKVRSFDNRYYNKGSVAGEISLTSSPHSEELELILKQTKVPLKIPVTGPYTMADWSFNDHYGSRLQLADAFADLIRGEIETIQRIWKKYRGDEVMQIQIDEPAATTHPSEMDIVIESVNRSVRGIKGLETSIHVCYSKDYRMLYDRLPELELNGLNLEYSNRDFLTPGTGPSARPGFNDIGYFSEINSTLSKPKFLGIGVTDVHIDTIESVDLIADRIRESLRYVEDPGLIRLNPDCGLRTRSREIGYEKLRNMSLARDKIISEL